MEDSCATDTQKRTSALAPLHKQESKQNQRPIHFPAKQTGNPRFLSRRITVQAVRRRHWAMKRAKLTQPLPAGSKKCVGTGNQAQKKPLGCPFPRHPAALVASNHPASGDAEFFFYKHQKLHLLLLHQRLVLVGLVVIAEKVEKTVDQKNGELALNGMLMVFRLLP